MKNIANEYIEINKKFLTEYMKLIFEDNYDKEISDKYIEKYLMSRYFNYNEEEIDTTPRTKILMSLKRLREKLLIEIPRKSQIIEDTYMFYHYIIYIDRTLWCKDINVIIDKMALMRIKLSMENNTEFCEKMRQSVSKNNKIVDELLTVEDVDKFDLKIKNISKQNKIYDTVLSYDIKFPEIYSEKSKNKVFESGIIKEDKLFIEYYLVAVEILKDIQKNRFDKIYLVEFASSLFLKQTKLERILSLIENDVILENVNLKIEYADILENKEKYYDLIRRGFKISVLLDNECTYTDEDIEKLDIFEYILINKKTENYTRILKNEKIANKIIGI